MVEMSPFHGDLGKTPQGFFFSLGFLRNRFLKEASAFQNLSVLKPFFRKA